MSVFLLRLAVTPRMRPLETNIFSGSNSDDLSNSRRSSATARDKKDVGPRKSGGGSVIKPRKDSRARSEGPLRDNSGSDWDGLDGTLGFWLKF